MPRATVLIYADDDAETLQNLRREVHIAERNAALAADAGAKRFGDDTPSPENDPTIRERRQAFNEFVDIAADRAEEWVLQHIGNTEFRELAAANPPRKVDADDGTKVTHPEDQGFEVNTEKLAPALLLYVDADDPEIRTVVKAGDIDVENNPAALRKRIKRLSAGQLDTLWIAAHGLNAGGISDPKSLRYSTAPTSVET